jgi:hypothetical protein
MLGRRRQGTDACGTESNPAPIGNERPLQQAGATKRWAAMLAVGALWLWPLAQHALVVYADVNPWKLAGFAMYCTPHTVWVGVTREDGPMPLPIEMRSLSLSTQQELVRFTNKRQVLGRLEQPTPVVRAIAKDLPDVRVLRVTVAVYRLNPATSMIEPSWYSYRFEVNR